MSMGSACSVRMQNNANSSTSSTSNFDNSQHFESCCRTVVTKTKLIGRHRWVIEGFSALPVQRLVSVTSPPFVCGGKKWELFLHNDGHSDQYAGCISVFLQLLEPAPSVSVNCGFKFTMLHPTDASKNVTKPSAGQKVHTFKAGDTNWGFYELSRRDRVFSEKYLWPNDAFVVEVELEVATGQAFSHEHVAASYLPSSQPMDTLISLATPLQPNAPCSCALRRDISDLLRNQHSADLVLFVGPQRERICTHRGILEARSSVFRAMFSSEMKDANEHLLELPDASPDAIRAVLEYMYSDCIPEYLLQSFATAVEVFQLADRWDLDRLTELVVPLISRHLSVANVFAALQFAETHRHSAGGARLRRVAIEFSRQHFEDVIDDGTAKIRKLQAAFLETHGVTVDLTEAEPVRGETYNMPARELNASQPTSTSTASLPFPGPTSSTGGGIMGISRSLFPLSAFSGITGMPFMDSDLFRREALEQSRASTVSASSSTSVVPPAMEG